MKWFFILFFLISLSSCYKGEKVDMIIHNGLIHLMNDQLEISEALAIHEGKIVEVGPERQIMNRYRSNTVINAKNRVIFPGLHDAHGHIMSLAKQMQYVDLRGSQSIYEVIGRLEKHQAKTQSTILIGRGWDQSLWGEEKLPNDSLLNLAFPSIPVALTRIDGHAMLVNQALRDLVGIDTTTKIEGGQINVENGKCTGILLDHALDFVNEQLPPADKPSIKKAIINIQDQLLAYGITHVHEAGLSADERDIFIELATEGKLKINLYAMLFPSEENIKFAQEHGHYRNNRLTIRSFKLIADGALGSYGACLLHPYSDAPTEQGMLLKNPVEIAKIAQVAKKLDYQLNTHCIGDSANRTLLRMIDTLMKDTKEHRWRIEHAQIIAKEDTPLFSASEVLPSVQPTHATSDQRWAEQRIGKDRLENGAYAYKSLLTEARMILLGTDFPIEDFNPFATIYAATKRKDLEGKPIGGFLPNEALTIGETMQGMTIWPAYGAFEESRLGSIRKGKDATLTILDLPFQNTEEFLPNYAWKTIVEGVLYFEME